MATLNTTVRQMTEMFH